MEFLLGAGGWAYFQVPGKTPLKAYSEVFGFVEVNSTFYEYPNLATVEGWRRTVPADFTFSVRCHQDLTHRIDLKPVEEAYAVFNRMKTYCRALQAPFLVLETPASQNLTAAGLASARNFLGSISTDGLQLVWEYRAELTPEVTKLMQEFQIINCVDLILSSSEQQENQMFPY
jgi:uncharacterized protein YecE (DUF72 family)